MFWDNQEFNKILKSSLFFQYVFDVMFFIKILNQYKSIMLKINQYYNNFT